MFINKAFEASDDEQEDDKDDNVKKEIFKVQHVVLSHLI
jgi:hypothetical protein